MAKVPTGDEAVEISKLRMAVVRGLRMGAVERVFSQEARDAILEGRSNPTLAELGLDSLARMELCIAIEVDTGVSIAPDTLDHYATIDDLVADLARRVSV